MSNPLPLPPLLPPSWDAVIGLLPNRHTRPTPSHKMMATFQYFYMNENYATKPCSNMAVAAGRSLVGRLALVTGKLLCL